MFGLGWKRRIGSETDVETLRAELKLCFPVFHIVPYSFPVPFLCSCFFLVVVHCVCWSLFSSFAKFVIGLVRLTPFPEYRGISSDIPRYFRYRYLVRYWFNMSWFTMTGTSIFCSVSLNFFPPNTQDTVVKVTKYRNKPFLIVLVSSGLVQKDGLTDWK